MFYSMFINFVLYFEYFLWSLILCNYRCYFLPSAELLFLLFLWDFIYYITWVIFTLLVLSTSVLTLSWQNQKWLSFAISIEPDQPAQILCILTRLYTVGWPSSSSHLDIPKMIMDSSKNRRLIIPFKKYGRLWVNCVLVSY